MPRRNPLKKVKPSQGRNSQLKPSNPQKCKPILNNLPPATNCGQPKASLVIPPKNDLPATTDPSFTRRTVDRIDQLEQKVTVSKQQEKIRQQQMWDELKELSRRQVELHNEVIKRLITERNLKTTFAQRCGSKNEIYGNTTTTTSESSQECRKSSPNAPNISCLSSDSGSPKCECNVNTPPRYNFENPCLDGYNNIRLSHMRQPRPCRPILATGATPKATVCSSMPGTRTSRVEFMNIEQPKSPCPPKPCPPEPCPPLSKLSISRSLSSNECNNQNVSEHKASALVELNKATKLIHEFQEEANKEYTLLTEQICQLRKQLKEERDKQFQRLSEKMSLRSQLQEEFKELQRAEEARICEIKTEFQKQIAEHERRISKRSSHGIKSMKTRPLPKVVSTSYECDGQLKRIDTQSSSITVSTKHVLSGSDYSPSTPEADHISPINCSEHALSNRDYQSPMSTKSNMSTKCKIKSSEPVVRTWVKRNIPSAASESSDENPFTVGKRLENNTRAHKEPSNQISSSSQADISSINCRSTSKLRNKTSAPVNQISSSSQADISSINCRSTSKLRNKTSAPVVRISEHEPLTSQVTGKKASSHAPPPLRDTSNERDSKVKIKSSEPAVRNWVKRNIPSAAETSLESNENVESPQK